MFSSYSTERKNAEGYDGFALAASASSASPLGTAANVRDGSMLLDASAAKTFDDRFGSIAPVEQRPRHVRFTPDSERITESQRIDALCQFET
jgi:hypothetical protein